MNHRPPLRRVLRPSRAVLVTLVLLAPVQGQDTRTYENRLTRIVDPAPLLAGHEDFVQPIAETERFTAPPLVDEEGATLAVRAWRFSYNARGVIELDNRLRGVHTAVIVVHPWGIDDGQGWQTPEPAGCAFQCTPAKNRMLLRHARDVVNPLLESLRPRVALVLYSLPGAEDPIRKKLYRSFRARPSAGEREAARADLRAKLAAFRYRGAALPQRLTLSRELPVVDYFRQLPGLDPGAKYNGEGFWQLPIPVTSAIRVADDDVVIYDAEGYEPLRAFLNAHGIRHVLLAGYNTDMCVISTTAGHKYLRQHFNVFLVGDATLATSPASPSPACATTAALAFASLEVLITQAAWVRALAPEQKAR